MGIYILGLPHRVGFAAFSMLWEIDGKDHAFTM